MKGIRNIIVFLVAVLSLVSLFAKVEEKTVFAADGGQIGDLTWWLDNEGTLTIYGEGEMKDFDTYRSFTPWYDYRYQIINVEIKQGVESIGSSAFYGCKYLEKIVIPDSVIRVGWGAYNGCSGLISAGPPGSGCDIEMGWSTKIPDYAFAWMDSIKTAIIPDGVVSIGEQSFENCSNLKTVILPESVKTIEKKAFGSCGSLTELSLPQGLESIGDFAFSGVSLSEIIIPKGVTSIGSCAFSGCLGLKKIIIPGGITKIDWSVFSGCDNLTDIAIPESVTSIEGYAFYHCRSLTKITIPDSVTSIGEFAFYECTNLKEIILSKNVKTLDSSAFAIVEGQEGLEKVAILNENLALYGDPFPCATIYGYKGSTAEEYAVKHNKAFKPLIGITSQPKTIYSILGKTVTMRLTAEGYGTIKYQWYYRKDAKSSWTAVSTNGTKEALSVDVTEKKDGYQYYCKVTNSALNMTVKSNIVKLLIVREKPIITTQPKPRTVVLGDKITFKVAADGKGLSYQWYYKASANASWTAIKAANGKMVSYSLTTEARHNGYQYKCVVSNVIGKATSAIVKLTVVTVAPKIMTQPKSASVAAKKKVTFKVVANGTALSYQWQYKKPGGAWTNVTATAGKKATYSFTATKTKSGYRYRCKVTNLKGSVTSKAVKLTVK